MTKHGYNQLAANDKLTLAMTQPFKAGKQTDSSENRERGHVYMKQTLSEGGGVLCCKCEQQVCPHSLGPHCLRRHDTPVRLVFSAPGLADG